MLKCAEKLICVLCVFFSYPNSGERWYFGLEKRKLRILEWFDAAPSFIATQSEWILYEKCSNGSRESESLVRRSGNVPLGEHSSSE